MVHSAIRGLLRVGAAAIVVAALVAFSALQGTMAQSDEIVIPISELNGSGVSGDATLTDNGDGTTTIDVLVDGAVGDHPIHLHSGTCAELGDVVVPLTDVGADGSSVTVVPVPLATIQDPEIGPHSINIHLSAEEISTYVACGDIPVLDAAAAGDEMTTDTAASDTTATTTPATGVGSTVAANSSLLAMIGMMIAGLLFAAGLGVRRSEARL